MRKLIAAAATGLMMMACAAPPPSGSSPQGGQGDSWGAGYRGLTAYISPPERGGLRFHVNRPAYVAMFEIVPNGGTRLVYPTPGAGRMDGFVFSGARVDARSSAFRTDYGFAGGSYAYSDGMARPRFLFLIASERPLDLDSFGAYGSGMRNVLGTHYYATNNAYATMQRLAEVALPSTVDDGSWTTDMYVYWPQALRQYRASRDVLIRCNGYTMFVAYEYAYQARSYLCGQTGDQVAVRPRRTPNPPPVKGSDSTKIERPDRREPVPALGEAALRRLTSSRQLQQPQTERPRERTALEGGSTANEPKADVEVAEPSGTVRPRPVPVTRSARPVVAGPPQGRAGTPGAEAGSPSRPSEAGRAGARTGRRTAGPAARSANPGSRTPQAKPETRSRPASRPSSPPPAPRRPASEAPAKRGGGDGGPDGGASGLV